MDILIAADELILEPLIEYIQDYLIKHYRDDLQIDEIEVWNYVITWGIAQNPSLQSDFKTWHNEDFAAFGKTIQQCIPLIRFFLVSSVDFYHYVKPFACILPDTLYEDLLHHYLVPNSETATASKYSVHYPLICDSSIIKGHHMKQIID